MFVLSVECPGAHAQVPETVCYADAYADHYGGSRALVHAIIAQESAWNPLAISKKECSGPHATDAAMYGVGNRFSLGENLEAGVQYLSELLAAFHGDMRLAVAACYCGPSHILHKGLHPSGWMVSGGVPEVRSQRRGLVCVRKSDTEWRAPSGSRRAPGSSWEIRRSGVDQVTHFPPHLPFLAGRHWRPNRAQQKLMRHAQVSTAMNVYGNALMAAKREANSKVVTMALRSA